MRRLLGLLLLLMVLLAGCSEYEMNDPTGATVTVLRDDTPQQETTAPSPDTP